MGFLTRFDLTTSTIPSSYGTAQYRASNMSEATSDRGLFTGTQGIMLVCGLRCSIYREEGISGLTRAIHSNSDSDWKMTTFNVAEGLEKVIVPSLLSPYQGTNLNSHLPGSSIPDIAPSFHLAIRVANISFGEFALGFLYASGEAQCISHEVVASGTNEYQHPTPFFVEVDSIATSEQSRITIVPSLLLIGLISIIGASSIAFAIAIYTWKSTTTQTFRQVNEVRLLVDSAANLKEDTEGMLQLAKCSNEDINAWAAEYKVHYARTHNNGLPTIVLEED